MRAVLLFCGLLLALLRPLRAQPSPTAILDRVRSSGAKPIDFHAAVYPDTVFVGQQVTYQVAVLLSDQARSRLRRNPEFLPPELRGLLAYELGSPRRVAPRAYGGGTTYEAHVFQRALFAVAPGVLTVPSPQLSYSLPQSASYFSREERHVVRAESARLVVRDLPEAGRPADFTGAVGVLRVTSRLDANDARVGDPLVLTVRVEGTGNVKLLPRPDVELSWATVVAGSERVQIDTTGNLVRGAREFDFILTPSRSGAVTLPVVRYSYFDPYRAQYDVAVSTPADLRVADGDLAAPANADDQAVLPLRPWRQESVRALDGTPASTLAAVVLLVMVAPVPALVALAGRRQRRRAASAPVVSAPPKAAQPPDTSPGAVARDTRRLLLEQLATRLHVAPTDLVAPATVERVLRRRGVTRATTRDVLALLNDLAVQGFGGIQPDANATDWRGRAKVVFDRVHAEAVPHGRTPLWSRRARRGAGGALLLAVALPQLRPAQLGAQNADGGQATSAPVPCESAASPVVGGTLSPTPLDLLVGEGVAAYKARRFTAAAQRLGAAAAACPRNTTAQVNWGTAAWAASDTLSAVLAWQRAARLDPLAADVQERLAMLPPGSRGGIAEVPMVPVVPLALFAVVAWCAAWALFFVAWRAATAASGLGAIAVLLLVAAVGAGGAAWWGYRALDATGLAVVRRPETLRVAPGFDANTSGGVSTGDVVRVSSMQEGWQRVEHTDGRSGWIPASRLAPLETDAPIR